MFANYNRESIRIACFTSLHAPKFKHSDCVLVRSQELEVYLIISSWANEFIDSRLVVVNKYAF